MDDKLKEKVIKLIKKSDDIDTFEISMYLMENKDKIDEIVDELHDEGLILVSA
jgi:hypothetical protein